MNALTSKHSFLDVGAPTNFYSPLEEGRVSIFKVWNIDNDYRAAMIASRPQAAEKLLAKQYLAQVEMGNLELQSLCRIAEEQGKTTEELRDLHASSVAMHIAAQRDIENRELHMDERFSKLVDATFETGNAITNSLSELTETIFDGAECVVNAIDASREILHSDLQEIAEELRENGNTLLRVEKLLSNPSDTRVRELLVRTTSLIREGMLGHGKWRYDNYRDALTALREATSCAIGNTNALVWFQFGYLTWQCYLNEKNVPLRKQKLIESRDAFERAARLFTSREQVYFVKSLRHRAHLQYLLGDAKGAEATLILAGGKAAGVDVAYELARYVAAQGKKQVALDLLWNCFYARPALSSVVFGEADFAKMRSALVDLIVTLRNTLRDEIFSEIHKIGEVLPLQHNGASDAGLFGSYLQHEYVQRTAQSARRTKSLFNVRKLLKNTRSFVGNELLHTPTTAYDLACIYALYGRKDDAATLLKKLIALDHKIIFRVQDEKVLESVRLLIEDVLLHHAKNAQDRALQNITALEATVREAVDNYGKRGIYVVPSKICKDVLSMQKKLVGLNYVMASEMANAATRVSVAVFNRQRGEFLHAVDVDAQKLHALVVDESRKCTADELGLLLANFDNTVLLFKKHPHLCPPSVRTFCALVVALDLYNRHQVSDLYELQLVSSNGLGSYWKFSFREIREEQMHVVEFYIAHKKEGAWYRQPVPFTSGEHIPLRVFVPSAMKWMKNEQLGRALMQLSHTSRFD